MWYNQIRVIVGSLAFTLALTYRKLTALCKSVMKRTTKVTSINTEQTRLDPSHEDEDAWTCINDSRIMLIRKQLSEGLSGSEQALLDSLEAAMNRHNDVIAPLPWGIFSSVEQMVWDA